MSDGVNEDKLLNYLDENELLKHIKNMNREAKEEYRDIQADDEFVIAQLSLMNYISHKKLNKLTKALIILTGVLIIFTAILVYFTILLTFKTI
jgi:hypothetical protein